MFISSFVPVVPLRHPFCSSGSARGLLANSKILIAQIRDICAISTFYVIGGHIMGL